MGKGFTILVDNKPCMQNGCKIFFIGFDRGMAAYLNPIKAFSF